MFGSVEKLPSEKVVPEFGKCTATHLSSANNGHGEKENRRNSAEQDMEGRPRTYSLGEKGYDSQSPDSKNSASASINKPRPGPTHASSTGTGGAVVGTCNEHFFKSAAKKNTTNESPPVTNIVPQASKVKQRRFRVESSDR